MKRGFLLAIVCATAATPVLSQSQQVSPNYRVVEHGHAIKLAGYGSFDADCRSLGRATINLVSPPQGGQVETEAGSDFPNFTAQNVRWKCDRIRGPETILYYNAAPNFTGADNFTVEIVFSDGSARQERWTVNVR